MKWIDAEKIPPKVGHKYLLYTMTGSIRYRTLKSTDVIVAYCEVLPPSFEIEKAINIDKIIHEVNERELCSEIDKDIDRWEDCEYAERCAERFMREYI